MASALFTIKDTEEARKELSLLLQIDPSTLDNISQAGQLTVDFQNLAEDMALQVLSRAVSNHGFTVTIGKHMAQPALTKDAQVSWPAPLTEPHRSAQASLRSKSETAENMAKLAKAVTPPSDKKKNNVS